MYRSEHVHSKAGACFAVGCMMMGLLGMAYFSVPDIASSDYQGLHRDESVIVDDDDDDDEREYALDPTIEMEWPCTRFRGLRGSPSEDDEEDVVAVAVADVVEQNNDEEEPKIETSQVTSVEEETNNDNVSNDISIDPTTTEEGDIDIIDETSSLPPQQQQRPRPDEIVVVCGMKWQRRTLGILSAMFSGIYGGSIMVPMKWAPDDAKGLGYLISFAIGAATTNMSLWMIRYLYLCQKHLSPHKAYYALPSFHLRKMWLAGGASGLLWSIGNLFSILSVEFLGEGVGYSVVQASMLGTYVCVCMYVCMYVSYYNFNITLSFIGLRCECTFTFVDLLFCGLTPSFLLSFHFHTNYVRTYTQHSERFVGNFLLSRNSRRRDDCQMVLFCLAYSSGYITAIDRAS
jgi:hypothetical protein